MAISAAGLNRATLARQLLLRRERLGAVEAVRRVVALQAQEPASLYVALWNRVEGFDGADLDRAFAEREVVRAAVVRITLHAVTAEDHPAFYAVMLPVSAGVTAHRPSLHLRGTHERGRRRPRPCAARPAC
jgi:hypothetical protein